MLRRFAKSDRSSAARENNMYGGFFFFWKSNKLARFVLNTCVCTLYNNGIRKHFPHINVSVLKNHLHRLRSICVFFTRRENNNASLRCTTTRSIKTERRLEYRSTYTVLYISFVKRVWFPVRSVHAYDDTPVAIQTRCVLKRNQSSRRRRTSKNVNTPNVKNKKKKNVREETSTKKPQFSIRSVVM